MDGRWGGGARKCEGSKGAGWGADRKEHQMRTWVATPFLPQIGTRKAPSASGLTMKALCLYYDAGYCDLAPKPGPAPVPREGKGLSRYRPQPCSLVRGVWYPLPPPAPLEPPPSRQPHDSLPGKLRVMPPNSPGLKSRPFPLCKCNKRKFIKPGLCT